MTSAMVVTISKYNNALPPTLPTFFKLPMPLIPNEMVRKMIGLINTFTISIKYLPKGCIFIAVAGAKCPSKAPVVIAVKTQKVRLVNNFFIIAVALINE